MKNLILTFDYELFLGRQSGRPEDCMIRPTEALLAAMDRHGCKGLFFVDATYLRHLQAKQESLPQAATDLRVISEQIEFLVREGHEIGLHLHPHWEDAQTINLGKEWDLSQKRYYRFHALSAEQKSKVFRESFAVLNGIVSKASPQSSIRCYRAGGWSLQPFNDFAPFFREFGIRCEFSVRPGFASFTDAQWYDFTAAPDQDFYPFSTDVCQTDPKGEFIQFPISSVNIPDSARKWNGLRNRVAWKLLKERTYGKGIGTLPQTAQSPPEPKEKPRSYHYEMAAIELLTRFTASTYFQHLGSAQSMQFISHPKMITDHNLLSFRKFLQKAYARFEIEGNVGRILAAAIKD